jgi:hypothetical protein
MLFSLFISFCHYDILNPAVFTGFDNYRLMFSDDRLVPIALSNTLYMMIGVPVGMAASLAVAMLLNQNIRGMAAWRTFFYLPAIVPMVAASILWIWIFNPQGGAINLLLEKFGVDGPRWLQSANWSKPSLIIMGLWGAGGGMIGPSIAIGVQVLHSGAAAAGMAAVALGTAYTVARTFYTRIAGGRRRVLRELCDRLAQQARESMESGLLPPVPERRRLRE